MPSPHMNRDHSSISAPRLDVTGCAPKALSSADFEELQAIMTAGHRSTGGLIQDLLQFGTNRLSVQTGYLSRIHVGHGSFTIVDSSDALPSIEDGGPHTVAATYSRQVIAESAPLALHEASAQGWADDAAYRAFGFEYYLGAKVLVEDHLYGTVCFADTDPHSTAVEAGDTAVAVTIGRLVGQVLEQHSTGSDADPPVNASSPSPPTTGDHGPVSGASAREPDAPPVGTGPAETGPAAHGASPAASDAIPPPLASLFRHSPDMITLYDREGNVLASNQQFCENTGYTTEEITGMKVWEVEAGTAPQQARSTWTQMAPGDRRQLDRRYRRCDGSTFPVEIHLHCRTLNGATRFVAMGRDMSGRAQEEPPLREERTLLDQVFRTSPTAIIVADRDGDIVRMNDRAQAILGLDQEDAMSTAYNASRWEITASDGSALPDEELPFARVRDTGAPVFNVEHAIHWPDGTRRLLSVSGAPLYDENTFRGAIFHLDDITSRRRDQKRLRESEQQFRGVFENSALGIALAHPDGTLIEANPALRKMFRCTQQDLEGQHVSAFTHPDHIETDRMLFRELIAGRRHRYTLKKRYLRQDGEPFWGRLTVSRQEGPDGLQIIAVVEDIDRRKQQKEELRLFKEVVEQAYDGVMITEAAAGEASGPEIRYVNPALCNITGYEAEELIGQTPAVLQGPDTDPAVLNRLRDRLQKGLPFEGETRNYQKDGTPYINHWNIVPIRNDNGAPTHWVSVQRDVTEARRATKQLLELQDEERRHIEQEIHDEMGGLLTTLQMTVELARMQAQEERTIGHMDDLESLISELSSVARDLSQRIHPGSLDDYGISAVISALTEEFESRHGLTVDLHNEIDADERFSSLIETTAYHVLREALWNAAQHAQPEEIEVTATHSDHQLRLQVLDDGVGFDPMAQSNSDLHGLLGIRIRVERLNGEVKIDSTPGEGTRLSIMLPLTPSHLP